MKPINLKIKGINSYVSEQEVCFDKLAQSNLFGIFGETGSGKTTILDAIVIALYGSSDRETIQNIINVNSKEAHIYFSFECEASGENKVFLVKRDYKVRASGVKSDAMLIDTATNQVLAEQTDNVNEYILKLIGVGKKEFSKCIALPQGEFDRFLMDTPANRKKTIAKLFNLEDFGANLQDKIKRKRDIVTLNKLNIQEKIEMFGNVDDHDLQDVKKNLSENEKELEKSEKELKDKKQNYEQLVKNLELTKELNSRETELMLLKSETKQIEELKKQVEFTEKYGQYSIKLNKKNNIEKDVSAITLELKEDKQLLINATDELENLDDQLNENGEKLKALKEQLKSIENDKELRAACLAKIEQLEAQKKFKEVETENLLEDIRTLKIALGDYKTMIDDAERDSKNIELSISDNNAILDKLKDVKSIKSVEGILDYISYARTLVNPDSLAEVNQFDIYGEVNNLLNSLADYEQKTRTQVIGLQNDYEAISRYSKDFDKLQQELTKANGALVKQNEELKMQINKVGIDRAICEKQITEKQFALQDCKDEVRLLKSHILDLQAELKNYTDEKTYQKLYNSVEELEDLVKHLNLRKIELNDEKNKSVVAIEVAMTVLENYKKQLKEVDTEIKKLNIKSQDNVVYDTNLCLDDNKLDEAKLNISDFETKMEVLNSKIKELKQKLNEKTVTEEQVKDEFEQIEILENKIKTYSINVALAGQAVGRYIDAINKINTLKDEKEKIQKQLDNVNELASLTANGKLLDYVSEEYMLLITQFSNRFVYRISKGKYMLKYNGEFYVIDNFNGGVSRGVKTLSGGERFIISLSLALGISQSIAVNNNKKFNFFFIDEGFGSLSDNYIETVLDSFNSLIQMGFTVGFISHVDKMQNFINNRIVVTKSNNEEGSIIKQY